uniref:Putative LOV domain-containing protein n=1 Tax=Laurelia sempervirens TaxID=63809 RepID=A0A126X3V3_9MAGN|nr:putative LOV domain-containing protein [Laurelia sempervirens]
MGLRIHTITAEEEIRRRRRIVAKMDSELGHEGYGLIDDSLSSRYSALVREALDELPDNFLITDPGISGNPIVFASRGFLKMSGYSREEVLGRNGRIFQGAGTNRRSVSEIREAIRQEKTMQLSLLNYKKDGTPIWVLFHLSPVFSKEDGRVSHFVAVQVPISTNSWASGSGSRRNWSNTVGDSSSMREIFVGSCRREVCLDSVAELSRSRPYDSYVDSDYRGLEAEESCEAGDLEKQKAATAVGNILSTLTQYSQLTGKVVCGNRCSSFGILPISSSLNISLGRIKQSFVLTDPHLLDMPIVYASDAFIKLTGYSRHEVLGRNCRFLQGPDTNFEALCQIRESIQTSQSCTVRILNYRKDRSSFWNLLHISPVRNASGKIAFYVGVQIDEGSKSNGQWLSPEMRQLGAVGAVKVAVRSFSMGVGPSKS